MFQMGGQSQRRSRPRKRLLAPSQAVDHRLFAFLSMITVLFILAQVGIFSVLSKDANAKRKTNIVILDKQELQSLMRVVLKAIPAKWRLRHAAVDQTNHDIRKIQHTFPVHVADDMEMIDHPGILMSDEEDIEEVLQNHKELTRTIRVPTFWNPSKAYGADGVRGFLGHHGERLMSPEEAHQVGSFTEDGLETIYVSIATYRDPECGPTVQDLYERAVHPERIRIAIIDQRSEGDPVCDKPEVPCETDPTQTLCKYRHLIESFEQPAQFSVGPVFARHLGHRMYRGEYFAMQVDSHVRFVQGWDEGLVQEWKSANNEMAVLTVYLPDLKDRIDPKTHVTKRKTRPIMCNTVYEGSGRHRHLRHDQQPEGIPKIKGEPMLEPFWAAGFSFARGHFVVQVPYDQYLPMVFQGEEISIGLRGFTYGYDYYAPERPYIFHMYHRKGENKVIAKFWENGDFFPDADVEGMKRLNAIIKSLEVKDGYFDKGEDMYGLGKARVVEKFYRTFGIHTDTHEVEGHLCQLIGKGLHGILKPALRSNGMGLNYDEIDFVYVDPDPEVEVASDMVEATRENSVPMTKEEALELVGRKISVKFSDGYYYKANVTDYDESTARHHVSFNDGDEDYDMTKMYFKLKD